jgi:hypothetical protein
MATAALTAVNYRYSEPYKYLLNHIGDFAENQPTLQHNSKQKQQSAAPAQPAPHRHFWQPLDVS